MIKLIDLLKENFDLYDVSDEEKNNIYQLYKNSYEKSVGNAWDKNKFFERAEEWDFFGDKTGYIAARLQGSGLYKLAVVGGSTRGILKGIQELNSLNKPVWGMVSSDILPMIKKVGFKTPNVLTMNILLRLIPKEVFGGVDFKINMDGSITLNYEDTGSAKKYFVGNQLYFDWLKSQIKDKIKDKMNLINLLKEVLHEAKQVGDLYHFTPLSNITNILKSQYLLPNDEDQISTSIRPNMDIKGFQDMKSTPVVRLMLDGNKISNKYKIQPFAYGSEYSEIGSGEDLGEEAIVTNGRNFYFMPYLKRIDIFLNKKSQINFKITKILDKMNIPYKIYEGTPISHIPYTQPKEGDPSNIKYKPVPKEISISNLTGIHPYPNFKSFEFTNNPKIYPLLKDPEGLNNTPQNLTRPLSIFKRQWDTTPLFPEYYVSIDSLNHAEYDLKNSKQRSEKTGDEGNEIYLLGRDYSNDITQELLKSIEFKTWDELNMSKDIENIKQEWGKHGWWYSYKGLMLFPKKIADTYLIATQVKPYENKKFIIPKK
jgi:hypothetical protein